MTAAAQDAETETNGAGFLEPILMTPLTVNAPGRDERTLLETPGTVTILTDDEMQRLLPSTFEDVFATTPGVNIDGGPRGVAQEPNIRGFRDEQVVLRLDGARQNFNRAHSGRFFIDPSVLNRIEVVRGASSTLYGSGAMGGVISLETKDAHDLLDEEDSFGGRFHTTYSTNGGEWFNGLTLYGDYGDFDALGFAGYRPMSDDLEDGDGAPILNSEVDVRNGLVKFGYEPGASQRLEFGALYYHDEGTLPPNANATATSTTIADRNADVRGYQLSYELDPADNDLVDLSVLAYINDLAISEDRLADGRLDESNYRTYGFDIVNRSDVELGLPVRLTYGFEGYLDMQTGTRNGAVRQQFPDAEALYLAGFAQADLEVSEFWTVSPGLRFDYFSLDPDTATQPERSESQVSPRLTVSFEPNESMLIWAGWARAFRAPSLTELYNDGIHFSVPGFGLGPFLTFTGNNLFIPNPDLKAERSNYFELGSRLYDDDRLVEDTRIMVAGSIYYAEVDDYVDTFVTFIDADTTTGAFPAQFVSGSTRTRNIDAVLYGLELEASVDAPAWFFGAGWQVPYGEAADGSPLGSIPQTKLALTGGWRPMPDWEVGARATFATGQKDVPPDTTQGSGYSVFDVFASWEPTEGLLEGMAFHAGVDNVLDRQFTIYPNELPQPGRTFKLSAAFTF